MYFKPQKDITNEELALINGFFAMAITDNINNMFAALSNKQTSYNAPVKYSGKNIGGIGTVWLDDYIIGIMPANVKRHFSSF